MHSKLLGIAIVALLPLTGAVAATGSAPSNQACTAAVQKNYSASKNLKKAMEDAVTSGGCASNGQAANAGYSIAGKSATLQSIVASFAAANNLVADKNFAGVGGMNISFGSDGQGGGGGGTGETPVGPYQQ